MDWTEANVARALAWQVFDRKCIVLCPNTKWTGHELDVLGLTTDRRVIDIEIKVSRADLLRDRHKDKWFRAYNWRTDQPIIEADGRRRYVGQPIEWPEKVWKHYYAMPAHVWKPDLLEHISPRSGVLLLSLSRWDENHVDVRVQRRATPNRDAGRISHEDVLDIARLCNLRMWAALAKEPQPRAGEL